VGAEDADRVSVVSVLRLEARPGSEQALARAFAELGVFECSRESGGFRGGRMLLPRSPGEPVLVVAEWDGEADYERWLANPVREDLKARLEPLLAAESGGGALYEEGHRG
jgi:heme-degrading monooxygenase HmoA